MGYRAHFSHSFENNDVHEKYDLVDKIVDNYIFEQILIKKVLSFKF